MSDPAAIDRAAREDYALDRMDVGGPVPPTEARRRAAARMVDGRPAASRYWRVYAEAGEAEERARADCGTCRGTGWLPAGTARCPDCAG